MTPCFLSPTLHICVDTPASKIVTAVFPKRAATAQCILHGGGERTGRREGYERERGGGRGGRQDGRKKFGQLNAISKTKDESKGSEEYDEGDNDDDGDNEEEDHCTKKGIELSEEKD